MRDETIDELIEELLERADWLDEQLPESRKSRSAAACRRAVDKIRKMEQAQHMLELRIDMLQTILKRAVQVTESRPDRLGSPDGICLICDGQGYYPKQNRCPVCAGTGCYKKSPESDRVGETGKEGE